ncbi:hypothetical protein GCM10010277_25730 [Streptomyces longisporoflavus]|uniref:hypothetical protein n=1 Tax=Streptomyces longisporoflavus TaxID=28044 RepID=UPI00167E6203|nr:hypothetical protein [Streptomyces longisporoflavus]GGV38503.1 hypothetical protein GCM10010277_25730 [Streptomyces longisporoflavus]
MSTSRVGKTLATLTAATAMAFGGTLMTATGAAAVGGSACEVNIKNTQMIAGSFGAQTRSGPGTSYSKKAHLASFEGFYARCYAKNSAGNRWYYGDPNSSSSRSWVFAGNVQAI